VIPAEPYRIADVETLLTPTLAIYPEIVDPNIAATIRLLGGDVNRWRPHLKTAKLGFIMRRMVERGVAHAKCSTTVELAAACAAGIKDVLLAYPVVGANAARVAELAQEHRGVRVSVLVENARQAAAWKGRPVGVFIDVNPGMDRTGIEQGDLTAIVSLVSEIDAGGGRKSDCPRARSPASGSKNPAGLRHSLCSDGRF
jgi:D-threonine aldolase